jgi:hypothetical protein
MLKRVLCAAGLAGALLVAAPGAAFANDSVARHGGHGSCDRHGRHHDGRDHHGRDHDGRDHDGRDHDGRDHDGRDHDGRDHDGLLGGLLGHHHHRDNSNADWNASRRCG